MDGMGIGFAHAVDILQTLNKENGKMKKGQVLINVNDIIGKRLGKLEVISYEYSTYDSTCGGKRMRHYYLCHCDCGKTKLVQRGQLVSEIVHSCGCGRKQQHD